MDEQQKEVFAARLERIQARKAAEYGLPTADELAMEAAELDAEGPVPVEAAPPRFGLARAMMVIGVLLALGGFGAHYALDWKRGTGALIGDLSLSTEATDIAPEHEPEPLLAFRVPRDDPRRSGRRRATERGWLHPLGSVATPDGASVSVADIADGFDAARTDRVPREVRPFAANAECTLRRPAPGEVVRNVRIGRATVETDIHALTSAGIADATLRHARAALFDPGGDGFGATAPGRLGRVDVFVTDTSAPVYLVLQSLEGNTLWNVHRGQGVRIAHVAMIGHVSGIVLPEGIGFEALRIGDFGTGPDARCQIAPVRLPKAAWAVVQAAEDGEPRAAETVRAMAARHRAFAAWFAATTGADAEAGLTEADGAGHVLVGAVPRARLGYRRITGRIAHVAGAEQLVIGDDRVPEAHRRMLLAAAGGDLARVRPPPVRLPE